MGRAASDPKTPPAVAGRDPPPDAPPVAVEARLPTAAPAKRWKAPPASPAAATRQPAAVTVTAERASERLADIARRAGAEAALHRTIEIGSGEDLAGRFAAIPGKAVPRDADAPDKALPRD